MEHSGKVMRLEFVGNLKSVSKNLMSGNWEITFDTGNNISDEIDHVNGKLISVVVKAYRKKRSLDANAMMWACLQEIAENLHTDKWSVYLMMLKRYGQFTYACVKPNAKEAFMKQWRECEEVGEININGEKAIQLLCYFGSSQYDTKEFSILLDGILSEMKEMGIDAPCSKEMRRLLDDWNAKSTGKDDARI